MNEFVDRVVRLSRYGKVTFHRENMNFGPCLVVMCRQKDWVSEARFQVRSGAEETRAAFYECLLRVEEQAKESMRRVKKS